MMRAEVSWTNVLIALCFVLLDVAVSVVLRLELASLLLIAAGRCIIQLSFMGVVLRWIFSSDSPWAVAGLSCGMLLLAANEVTTSRIKHKHDRLMLASVVSLVASVGPVVVLGSKFALRAEPFWTPNSLIPILGMLAGNSLSSMAYVYVCLLILALETSVRIALNSVMRSLTEERDKIEVYIAFGATRVEACMPLVRDALRLALLPTINQMSVIGLISIPGMMSGAILGGESVEQAARLQMIIMFLITSSAVLCSSLTILFAIGRMIDGQHRIRLDHLASRPTWNVWLLNKTQEGVSGAWETLKGCCSGRQKPITLT